MFYLLFTDKRYKKLNIETEGNETHQKILKYYTTLLLRMLMLNKIQNWHKIMKKYIMECISFEIIITFAL